MNVSSHPPWEDWIQRPLVSLVLLSYNNAPYLKEALKGAFGQTYDRLEIILADDCSTDGSYAILEAAANSYEGPHALVLNRNPQNLGIAGNLNRVAQIATGSVITLAAGDDISDPRRVQLVAEVFARTPEVRAVVSGFIIIDEAGHETGRVVLPRDFDALSRLDSVAKDGGALALGAVFSYHRDCFLFPGPIPEEIICEDCFLPMRALILGKIAAIREPLVCYRKHDRSSTAEGLFKLPKNTVAHQRALLADLDASHSAGALDDMTYRKIRGKLLRYRPHVQRLLRLQKRPLAARLYGLLYSHERTLRRLGFRLFGGVVR